MRDGWPLPIVSLFVKSGSFENGQKIRILSAIPGKFPGEEADSPLQFPGPVCIIKNL